MARRQGNSLNKIDLESTPEIVPIRRSHFGSRSFQAEMLGFVIPFRFAVIV